MKKINIIITLLSLFCIGCYTKVKCPGFPNDLNIFPYYENQKLKFINSQQDFRDFIPYQIRQQKPFTCKTPLNHPHECECTCSSYSELRAYFVQNTIGVYAMCWLSGEGRNGFYAIEVDFSFSYDTHSDNFTKTLFEGNTIPHKDIGKYVEDTICIENENNKSVTKIVVVKGKGLVSYTTADGEEWKLVE